MQITDDVSLPAPLVAAAVDEELVLFVGAGVSVNPPACLPLFVGLARQLAEAVGLEMDESMEPDAFIGRLDEEAPGVRERVRQIISNPESKPNDMHRAIVRLAQACGKLRIVSTNYDEHLAVAASELEIDIGDIYHSPAVPLGRDFVGLVYLHGQVSRRAEELVLTDQDFGRAYLFDGWARRFVTDLFLNRTVLFIGYSHNDAVMKYLARGLPPDTKRFAFTDTPLDDKWDSLGIEPIGYPNQDEHIALTRALDEWARRLSMGQLDHRARVHEIVQGGPPKLPVEIDYLAKAIASPVGVRAFCEKARGEEWLKWVEQTPLFKAMFGLGGEVSPETEELARWFADTYVADPAMQSLALGVFARHGLDVDQSLYRAIERAILCQQTRSELVAVWSAILVGGLRTCENSYANLLHLFIECGSSPAPLLSLFRRVLQPRLLVTEPWFSSREGVQFEISWAVPEEDIKQLWMNVGKHLRTVAPWVLQVVEQTVRDAYELLGACCPENTWDRWSFHRSAIEPHQQDSFPRVEDILIDALRDSAALLAQSDKGIVDRWLQDEYALFRRLGLHLVIEDAGLSAHEKLARLLGGSHLYDLSSKHEVFRLLATIVPHLDCADRRLLLDRIQEGPPLGAEVEEQRLRERRIFDILEWLTRYIGGWRELEWAVAAIRKHRPDIEPREHPDFNRWMESATWVEEPAPFAADELVAAFNEEGAMAVLHTVYAQTYCEHPSGGPTWAGARSSLGCATRNCPELGLRLLGLESFPQRKEITGAVIAGLAQAVMNGELIRQVIDVLERYACSRELVRPISEFCLSVIDGSVERDMHYLVVDLDSLVAKLWQEHIKALEEDVYDDWLLLGLNTWPGMLAQYWIKSLQFKMSVVGDGWTGLSENDKCFGESLAKGARASMAILAVNAYFIFRADANFACAELFPMFDSSVDESRARQVWASYLHCARVDDVMLEAGFWNLLISARDLIDASGRARGLAREYWRLVGSICIRSRLMSSKMQKELVVQLAREPEQLRNFTDGLAGVLHDLEEADVKSVWDEWLAEVIETRLSPRSREAECAVWGDLALRMPSQIIIEALRLTDKAPGPLGSESVIKIPDEVLSENPDQIALMICRRLEKNSSISSRPKHWRSLEIGLHSLVDKLQNYETSGKNLQKLVECALKAGFNDATDWLPSA